MSLDLKQKISAILGPTNTGKTHKALEIMLKHNTGMIGVPLRLLARELYDKISSKIGKQSVALITGEEKHIPKYPKYYICTVEAMPTDIAVDIVIVDEVQLANDIERGHIFTKRIFDSRGRLETLFLGSDTIEKVLKKIIPEIDILKQTRFSSLSYETSKKISRLRKKTAIIAFSINRVYEIADFVRQQNGGAAVVLGALSPRTRNAQVELYQSGQADYLVATDAIGMGLNMDIDHIAFDSIKKFDGNKYRYLYPHEIGQIAGRAGRYMNNGTFCMTYPNEELDANLVSAIENHKFLEIDNIKWRNSNLDFSSIKSILDSLSMKPKLPFLKLAKAGEDQQTLEFIYDNQLLNYRSLSIDELRLLWDLCQIPDYRQTGIENHTKIALKIFRDITESNGYIDPEWFENEVNGCAKFQGDIDSLSNKISFIRTCNFIANKKDWIKDTDHWQKKTRNIEDKLSDKLHERLMQRFIDKRNSILINHTDIKNIEMDEKNKINIGSLQIGTINGLKFKHQSTANLNKSAKNKLNKIIISKLDEVSRDILAADLKSFHISHDNKVLWNGSPIAELRNNSDSIIPNIFLLCDDNLSITIKKRLNNKLNNWLTYYLKKTVPGLIKLINKKLKSPLSAIQFSLLEGMGVVKRDELGLDYDQLTKDEKKEIRSYGLFIGQEYIYLKNIFDENVHSLRVSLLKIKNNDLRDLNTYSSVKITKKNKTHPIYSELGYFYVSQKYVRPDLIENLLELIRKKRGNGSFQNSLITPEFIERTNLPKTLIDKILTELGYVRIKDKKNMDKKYWIRRKKNDHIVNNNSKNDNNPFSILKNFKNASNL
ncbi:MAG: helicase-related protein [Hyphomicrobiales bacterium]